MAHLAQLALLVQPAPQAPVAQPAQLGPPALLALKAKLALQETEAFLASLVYLVRLVHLACQDSLERLARLDSLELGAPVGRMALSALPVLGYVKFKRQQWVLFVGNAMQAQLLVAGSLVGDRWHVG